MTPSPAFQVTLLKLSLTSAERNRPEKCLVSKGKTVRIIRKTLRNSGTKKEPKPKLFGPDIFRWGRGLPRQRVGAKKFGMSLETREIKLLGRDIPGFCRDIPGVPEKFEKKRFVFNSRPLETSPKMLKSLVQLSKSLVGDLDFFNLWALRVKTFIFCYRTPGPQKGFRRVSQGASEGVSEGFSKGFRRASEGSSAHPF